MNLYFLGGYNNYYNRQVKKFNTAILTETGLRNNYNTYILGSQLGVRNFDYANGISTTQIVNGWEGGTPDYCLAYSESTGLMESAWFVTEADYQRNGQYRIHLRRDIVAENYSAVLGAPTFIEKATPTDINDPAIFNNENMTFNQIKMREQLLKDESKCAWVVGYVPRDTVYDGAITASYQVAGSADITVETLGDYAFYEYVNTPTTASIENQYRVRWNTTGVAALNPSYSANVITRFDNRGSSAGWQVYGPYSSAFELTSLKGPSNIVMYNSGGNSYTLNGPGITQNRKLTEAYGAQIDTINTTLRNVYNRLTPEQFAEILNENGKVIYERSTGFYYRLRANVINTNQYGTDIVPVGSNLFLLMQQIALSVEGMNGNADANSFSIDWTGVQFQLELDNVYGEIKTTLRNDRYHLDDSPYDMFAIPYPVDEAINIYQNGVEYVTSANPMAAITIATAIMPSEGSGTIYDLQLLPYCPVSYALRNGTIDLGNASYSAILDNEDRPVNVVLWARTSSRTFDIELSIPKGQTVLERKINNETKKYRLCSPNYAAASDFSAEMNNGVEYVNVDFNYKPFNPYIHLNINYKGLYGADYNDSRGLILGGDFSLPQVTSAWANYQLQNKNYQSMFDRQIENMEVNNKMARMSETVGAITGAVGGTLGGATTGALVGGPIGAVAGGVAGGLASTAGAIADRYYNEQMREEVMDYTKDMYEMNLQNIQAIPQALAKTSAITLNNKYFPFVEFYECTETEKNALINKITYNGMTIGRIGVIADFVNENETYIKGKLIRLDTLATDYHTAIEIAAEINKGVFIK